MGLQNSGNVERIAKEVFTLLLVAHAVVKYAVKTHILIHTLTLHLVCSVRLAGISHTNHRIQMQETLQMILLPRNTTVSLIASDARKIVPRATRKIVPRATLEIMYIIAAVEVLASLAKLDISVQVAWIMWNVLQGSIRIRNPLRNA